MEVRGSKEEEEKKSNRRALCFDQYEVTTITPSVRWFVKSIHIFSVPESNNRPDYFYIYIALLPPFLFFENNETDRQLVENGGGKGRKAAFLSRHERCGRTRIHHG